MLYVDLDDTLIFTKFTIFLNRKKLPSLKWGKFSKHATTFIDLPENEVEEYIKLLRKAFYYPNVSLIRWLIDMKMPFIVLTTRMFNPDICNRINDLFGDYNYLFHEIDFVSSAKNKISVVKGKNIIIDDDPHVFTKVPSKSIAIEYDWNKKCVDKVRDKLVGVYSVDKAKCSFQCQSSI